MGGLAGPSNSTFMGTVTSVSGTNANGVSFVITNPTTTPNITISLGAITPTTVNGLTLAAAAVGFTITGGATPKTLTVPLDATVSGTNTGDQTTSGTLNRITVTNGATNPVIDIAATYVGQASITTVGTLATGVWNATVMGVTFGGTGTVTQFTAGSVVFAGPSGVYTQDNANLFWDDTNNRLGIATASPGAPLHVKNAANSTGIMLDATSANSYTDIQTQAATQGIRMFGGTAYNTGPAFQIWPTGSSFQGLYFDAGNASGADIQFRKSPAGAAAMVIKQSTGLIGIQGVTPGAFIDISAATTSNAQIRLRTGTAPTSPNDGDMWNDSTRVAMMSRVGSNTLYNRAGLFMQTADQTITGTTTETTIFGTGIGSKTMAANTLTIGKVINIIVSGVFTTPVAAGNLTIRVKFGSTTIATGTISTLINSATNAGIQFNVTITTRTTGASGTVVVDGSVGYDTTGVLTRNFVALNNAGATSTIDTTASQVIDVTAQYATGTGNTLKTTTATIELTA